MPTCPDFVTTTDRQHMTCGTSVNAESTGRQTNHLLLGCICLWQLSRLLDAFLTQHAD